MKLLNLLEHLQSSSSNLFNEKQLICFKGSYYPVLFFSLVLNQLKQNYGSGFESIALSEHDLQSVLARLEMSFLGSRTMYWMRDIQELDDKTKKKIFLYLSNYKGPNTIILCMADVPANWQDATIIELPEKVDKKLFIELIEHEHNGSARKNKTLIDALFDHVEHITLDHSYALMRYVQLVGTSKELFIKDWLNSLVIPEQSLFTLSQHFFAKDPRKFFAAWALMADEYADIFWISFWSEQLWRASMAVRYMQEHQFAQAKTIAYRLPFSFTQRDWKKVTFSELQRAHSYLYQLDHNLKNGGSIGALEVLYSNFFLNVFSAG
jgi:hypothetical protein